MNFDDTPQEAAFRARARAWLEAFAKPRDPDDAGSDPLREREDEDSIRRAKAWQLQKFDAGRACLTWPRECGGQDAGRMEQVIWGEEEGRFETPPDLYAIGHGMLGLPPEIRVDKDRPFREIPAGRGRR